MSTLKFIDSAGGPLIMMEKFLLPDWNGIGEDFGLRSDYDRACEIEDYLGLVDINDYQAVVFGAEPMMTCWFRLNEYIGIVARINCTANLDITEGFLTSISTDQFPNKSGIELNFKSDELILFDSACGYQNLDDSLTINLIPGKYIIQSSWFEPNTENSFLLHPIILQS